MHIDLLCELHKKMSLLQASLGLFQLKMVLQMACLILLNHNCQVVAWYLNTALDLVQMVLLLWLATTILSTLNQKLLHLIVFNTHIYSCISRICV